MHPEGCARRDRRAVRPTGELDATTPDARAQVGDGARARALRGARRDLDDAGGGCLVQPRRGQRPDRLPAPAGRAHGRPRGGDRRRRHVQLGGPRPGAGQPVGEGGERDDGVEGLGRGPEGQGAQAEHEARTGQTGPWQHARPHGEDAGVVRGQGLQPGGAVLVVTLRAADVGGEVGANLLVGEDEGAHRRPRSATGASSCARRASRSVCGSRRGRSVARSKAASVVSARAYTASPTSWGSRTS